MYLYVYEGYSGGPERQVQTEELVKQAAELFLKEKGITADGMSMEIRRLEKGKPVFKELHVEFSVSHSDDLWVCLMSDKGSPVGVDIQIVKEIRQDRVMDRYFTEDEREYVNRAGSEAFFQIWARKEAYAKYTGRGLSRELSEIDTLNNKDVTFIDFDIRAGIKGSCCVKEKGELCLKMI